MTNDCPTCPRCGFEDSNILFDWEPNTSHRETITCANCGGLFKLWATWLFHSEKAEELPEPTGPVVVTTVSKMNEFFRRTYGERLEQLAESYRTAPSALLEMADNEANKNRKKNRIHAAGKTRGIGRKAKPKAT